MSWRKFEEIKSCGLFSLTLTSGLSFSFLRSLSSQNRGIYNVTVISEIPRFRDDSDLKNEKLRPLVSVKLNKLKLLVSSGV